MKQGEHKTRTSKREELGESNATRKHSQIKGNFARWMIGMVLTKNFKPHGYRRIDFVENSNISKIILGK